MMAGQNVYTALAFVFLSVLPSCVRSDIPTLKLCHNKTAISDRVDFNMDTSLIAGQDGYCSCRVSFKPSTELVLSVQKLTSPHCATSVSLSRNDLNTTCIAGYIQPVVYNISFASGTGLWIVVRTNGSSPEPMSGFIHLRTQHSTDFTFQCFEPKITSQTPSTLTTTTTTSSSTTSPPTTSSSTKTSSPPTPPPPTTTTTTERSTTITSSTMTKPNVHSTKKLPVTVIASSAVGGLTLIALLVLAIICCSRKKERRKQTTEMQDNTSMDGRNDEYLSMENELYRSSSEISLDPEFTHDESSTNVGSDEAANGMDGKTANSVIAPNGDVYNVVDKSLRVQDSPQRLVNHNTASSGDLYAAVEKSD